MVDSNSNIGKGRVERPQSKWESRVGSCHLSMVNSEMCAGLRASWAIVTEEWDNVSEGARAKTNNTGKLTAIIELMLWLREEAPDQEDTPVTIRFDSYYADNVARGIWEAKGNEELAGRVRKVKETLEQRRRYGRQKRHSSA